MAMSTALSCPTCGRCRYNSNAALRDHQRNKSHCFCKLCDRFFSTTKDYEVHMEVPHICRCGLCGLKFELQHELQAHQRASKHGFCVPCDLYFDSLELLRKHEKSPDHISQFHCCDCGRDSNTQHALEQHLKHKVHKVPQGRAQPCVCGRKFGSKSALAQHVQAKWHTQKSMTWCSNCDRDFKTAKVLEQHLNSPKHKSLSNIKCVASDKCGGRFSTPSALLHHLESGACHSGLTREKLNDLVLANDTERHITHAEGENPSQAGLSNQVGLYDNDMSFLEQGLLSTHMVIDVGPSRLRARSVGSDWTSSSEEAFFTPCGSSESLVLVDRDAVLSADQGHSTTIVSAIPSPAPSSSGVLVPTPDASETTSMIYVGDHDAEAASDFGIRSLATSRSNSLSQLQTPEAASDFRMLSMQSSRSNSISQLEHPRAGLRCPLCPPTRKVFHSVTAMQAHMASSAHSPRIFHCPLGIFPSVKGKGAEATMKTFSTLSGLTQHIESGACRGGNRVLKEAIAMVEGKLRELGFGNVKLLKEDKSSNGS